MWSPHSVFELAGYDREATSKLVDPIAAMQVAAARDAIGRLPEGLQSAASQLVGNARGGSWSAYLVFELAGYDHAAARAICDPIAAMQLQSDRDAAIAKVDKGLQSAARSLVGSLTGRPPAKDNSKDVFINVKDKISGTITLFYYSCSHRAAAWKLSAILGVPCSWESLTLLVSHKSPTACKKLITRSAVTDREKAQLLGEAQALTDAYKNSDEYTANAKKNANKAATFKAKHHGKGKA